MSEELYYVYREGGRIENVGAGDFTTKYMNVSIECTDAGPEKRVGVQEQDPLSIVLQLHLAELFTDSSSSCSLTPASCSTWSGLFSLILFLNS